MCDDPPCVAECPAGVPVKHFIRAIRFETPRRAINLIRDKNVLAGICGVACPVEKLCVGACTNTELSTPIAIHQLQHYAAVKAIDAGWGESPGPATGEKVAVIGGGPASLAAAAELARQGHKPTVFEKQPHAGGICRYGVPGHRVSSELVAGEVAFVKSLGVEFKTGSTFGEKQTVDDLFSSGFKAVFVSAGLEEAITPGIPGEDLQGVTTWKPFLTAFASFELGEGPKPFVPKSVLVVGGGSVAMDVASAAKSLGAEEIDLLCLESPCEMPADLRELDEVWDAGARFHTRSMPLEITGAGGKVQGLRATRIRWKKPDKFIPSNAQAIEGTEYWLPAEMVVLAIGARPAPHLAKALSGVDLDASGRIVVDPETGRTSRAGVYAGGDLAKNGGATIVKAVAEGKRAGEAIAAYLRQ